MTNGIRRGFHKGVTADSVSRFIGKFKDGILWQNVLSHLKGLFEAVVNLHGLKVEYASEGKAAWTRPAGIDIAQFMPLAAQVMRTAVTNARSFVRLGVDEARGALIVDYDGKVTVIPANPVIPARPVIPAVVSAVPATPYRRGNPPNTIDNGGSPTTTSGMTDARDDKLQRHLEGLELARELSTLGIIGWMFPDPATGRSKWHEYVHEGAYWREAGQRIRPPAYNEPPQEGLEPDQSGYIPDDRYYKSPHFRYKDPYLEKIFRMAEMIDVELAWPKAAGESKKIETPFGSIVINNIDEGLFIEAPQGVAVFDEDGRELASPEDGVTRPFKPMRAIGIKKGEELYKIRLIGIESSAPDVAWPAAKDGRVAFQTAAGDVGFELRQDGYYISSPAGTEVKTGTGMLFGGRLIFGDNVTVRIRTPENVQEFTFSIPLLAPTKHVRDGNLRTLPAGDYVVTSPLGKAVYLGLSNELLRTVASNVHQAAWTVFQSVDGAHRFEGIVDAMGLDRPHAEIAEAIKSKLAGQPFISALMTLSQAGCIINRWEDSFRLKKVFGLDDPVKYFEARGIRPVVDTDFMPQSADEGSIQKEKERSYIRELLRSLKDKRRDMEESAAQRVLDIGLFVTAGVGETDEHLADIATFGTEAEGRLAKGKQTAESVMDWLLSQAKKWEKTSEALAAKREAARLDGTLTKELGFEISQFRHDIIDRNISLLNLIVYHIKRGITSPEGALATLFAAFSTKSTDLNAIAQLAIWRLSPLAYSRLVDVFQDYRPRSHVRFAPHVDMEKVRSIFENLIENGIKYSREGAEKKFVRVTIEPDERTLVFEDNGIGMEPAFVPTWGTVQGLREGRAVNADGTLVEGTGTGSWIVRKYIEDLGWSLRIESTVGVGSKFIITIPEKDIISEKEPSGGRAADQEKTLAPTELPKPAPSPSAASLRPTGEVEGPGPEVGDSKTGPKSITELIKDFLKDEGGFTIQRNWRWEKVMQRVKELCGSVSRQFQQSDLPMEISPRSKNSLSVALMRLELARRQGRPVEPLIAEIQCIIEQESARGRSGKRPAKTAHATAILELPETSVIEIQPETEPDAPRLAVPATLEDRTYIPISTASGRVKILPAVALDPSGTNQAAEGSDRYVLTDERQFERTPLLIDGYLIDMGSRTATFGVLRFISSFAGAYPEFVNNVFLERLKRLTKFEETTRHSINEFRQIRAGSVENWTGMLTLFLLGSERSLAGYDEALNVARKVINSFPLSDFFNAEGRIAFRTTRWTDEQEAAENKLAVTIMERAKAAANPALLDVLQKMRDTLKLSPAVVNDLEGYIKKTAKVVSKRLARPSVPKDKMKESLAQGLATDPIYIGLAERTARLPAMLKADPFALFRWIRDFQESLALREINRAENLLMAVGLTVAEAHEFIVELSTFCSKLAGIDAIRARAIAEPLKSDMPLRFKLALISFLKDAIERYKDAVDAWHRIDNRMRTTSEYFRQAGGTIERFLKLLPIGISDARLYVLRGIAEETVIEKRKRAGVGRLDWLKTLASDAGAKFLDELTDSEKAALSVAEWFREMYRLGDAPWRNILQLYSLPGTGAAPAETRRAYEAVRENVMNADMFDVMVNHCIYPAQGEAVGALNKKAMTGRVSILHGIEALGFDAMPFAEAIRTAVAQKFFAAPETKGLSPKEAKESIDGLVARIIARNISPRGWSRLITNAPKKGSVKTP